MNRFTGRAWLCLVLAAFPLFAQFDGRLTGNVTDPSGAVVPGASVNLFLTGGKKPLMSTTTSNDGLYHFIGVRPGYYDVTVEAGGFVKVTVQNVSVDPSREIAIPAIKLELATVGASVEVKSVAQGVEATNAEIIVNRQHGRDPQPADPRP